MNTPKKLTGSDLQNYQGPDQIISSFDLDEIVKHSIDQPVIASRIPLLDYHLNGGFESGELITISGSPKTGKTLLAQSLTINFLNQDYKSLWFQYEVTPKRFLDSFPNIPMFYLPQHLHTYNLDWLETRILEAIIKHGIKIVFIDHLHYLFDIGKESTSLHIGSIVRRLKQIAVKWNLVIFLLCHMKKVSFDKEPSDEDIRDSSLIGSESDTVLIIWRKIKNENEAVLKLRYARRSEGRDRKVNLIKIDGMLRQLKDG